MTQLEQAIETIKDWERDIRFPNDDREAIRKDTLCEVLDYLTSLPSPPEGLEEAAEEYRQGEVDTGSDYIDDSSGDSLYCSACLKDAFKAGAEWMAGQGETHELTVESPVLGPPMICCPVHADNGDKVVVQIRKNS